VFDHVIILNEAHLRRLIRDYISYYHEDRTHDSLEKDPPVSGGMSCKPVKSSNLVSLPRVGGLYHRYDFSFKPLDLEKAKLFIAVDNVFNSKYAYTLETNSSGGKGYYYMPGTTFRAGINLNF
jgi:outer membrane receptor protein involved in Fe transport